MITAENAIHATDILFKWQSLKTLRNPTYKATGNLSIPNPENVAFPFKSILTHLFNQGTTFKLEHQ